MINQSVHVSSTNKGILMNTFKASTNIYNNDMMNLINSEELELNENTLKEDYTFNFASVAHTEKIDFSLMFA